MMPDIRRKAEILQTFTGITAEEHEQLKRDGIADRKHWSVTEGEAGRVISIFKSEAKEHYYFRQSRRCCYCSKELDQHSGSFDAEHIVDKSTFPQFMFLLENIAAVCKTCNGIKSKKHVLVDGVDFAAIPNESGDYLLVHPHMDEWDDFLDFDSIGRIVAKANNSKGFETIRICGINHLNAARLADRFLPANNKEAESMLEGFFRVKSLTWKRKKLEALRIMVDEFNLAKAVAIIEALEQDVAQIEADG